jgi:hypothetical protein
MLKAVCEHLIEKPDLYLDEMAIDYFYGMNLRLVSPLPASGGLLLLMDGLKR